MANSAKSSATPSSKAIAAHSSASPSQTPAATSHKAVGHKHLNGPDGHRHHHPGNRLNDRLPNERRPEDRNRLNERPRPDPFAPGSPEPPRRPTDPRLPIETPKLPISNKVPIHKTNPAAPAPNKQQEEQALIDQLFKLEGRDEYPRSFDDEIYELLMRRSYYEDLEDLE